MVPPTGQAHVAPEKSRSESYSSVVFGAEDGFTSHIADVVHQGAYARDFRVSENEEVIVINFDSNEIVCG